MDASTPSHITGAIAGAASRFAGSAASDTCWKCSAISGAVPSVAAVVIAATSATGPGMRRANAARSGCAPASSAATATNDNCHPGSSGARGFSASVTAAASSSAYQRCPGRPAKAATSPAIPITPARWIEGPAPVNGTYSATTAAASAIRTGYGTPTSAHAARISTTSSITFCPDTARMCASPEAWKSSLTSSLSRSSAPSTIPRSSAASGAASRSPSPASARRRTPSNHPANPPRRCPVAVTRRASIAACAFRGR